MGKLSIDELLLQATCAVVINGKLCGTAWLVSIEGHLLTAGHVLGKESPFNEVEVRFAEDIPRKAYKLQWDYQPNTGSDFAVLQLVDPPTDRSPLPISLSKSVLGKLKIRGYGLSLKDQSVGSGEFLGIYDPQDFSGNRLFLVNSKETGEVGYSGSAVFSEELHAVVAIQIEATTAKVGAGRDTVLAMPLYRIGQRWDYLNNLETTRQPYPARPISFSRRPVPKDKREKSGRPSSPSSFVTWLHISDLHFRDINEYNNSIIREAFKQDIQSFCQENDLSVDIIFVTGDIAFAGKSNEYTLATSFFNELLELTNISKEQLFIIPGNHDVDRQAISVLASNAAALLDNRNATNAFLASPIDCNYLSQRLYNYVNFWDSFFGNTKKASNIVTAPHYYSQTINISGKSVAILGLNSAWLCAGKDDGHNLLIGEKQIRDILSKHQDAELTIALMHHPFDWLKEFDEQDSQTLLNRACEFVLRGHLHKSRLEFTISPDANVMHIAAGALCETRERPNAYNIVKYDFEMGTGTIYLRRYSDESGGFFSKDTLTYHNAPDGEYKFRIKSSLPDHSEASSDTSTNDFLAGIAARLFAQSGNRRTAYPTDMNFRELFERNIHVPPSFLPRRMKPEQQ